MRSYCSLYVDAGYLMAAASTRVTGTSLRAATSVDVAALLASLVTQAEGSSGLPLLRTNWYDASRGGQPDSAQRQIATLPRVKLRLGRTGYDGEQKGVDLKIALDLISQARNRVADVVYLVTGDDDLTEAVEEAQHLGVQVILLAVPSKTGEPIAVSRHLQMAIDNLELIDPGALDTTVTKATAPAPRTLTESASSVAPVAATPTSTPASRPSPLTVAAIASTREPAAVSPKSLITRAPVVYSSTSGEERRGSAVDDDHEDSIQEIVTAVVGNWWRTSTPTQQTELLRAKPSIPGEIDRTLLLDLSAALKVYDIDVSTRFRLRDAFWEHVERLV